MYTLYFHDVPDDETEGFNFLTSDTFWTVAELFQRPYQPLVWIGLIVALIGTGALLVLVKIFGRVTFSPSKLSMHILFDLIEVGVNTGNVRGRKSTLKIMCAS